MAAITYDVGLDEDGDLPQFCRQITGLDQIAQRVRIRLRTFLGEWILDQSKGLPFFTWIAEKPPDAVAIGAVIRKEIETTTGVIRVDDFSSTWDASATEVTVTGTIVTQNGEIAIDVSPLGRVSNRQPAVHIVTHTGRMAP